MFDEYIESKKKDIIKNVCKTVSYPSISVETGNPNIPFGKPCKDVLKYVLSLGKKLGFRVKNINEYCGYIEFGEGEELVGIIGHLDVVPADDNWTYSPFKAKISDGYIYGRGTSDDKGPVIASLYAMKAVMDTTKVNKRVRLILGLNEEKDWKCIEHYKLHEELPTIGFSPDADFPCIYAEKGVISIYLIQQIISKNANVKIKEIDCNNNAINVVPKICHVLLSINNNIDIKQFISDLKTIIEKYSFEIDIYKIDDYTIKLTSYGTSSHAAHPDLGINAISRLVIVLNDILSLYESNISLFDLFAKYINTEYTGEGLNINYTDESGSLTLNVGDIQINNDNIQIGMNLRVPITIGFSDLIDTINSSVFLYDDISVITQDKKDPLYINKDDPLITTLCDIFNEYTDLKQEPIAIGGATYARAFENCVSFGANMPGQEDMCHKADEFIRIDNLILSSKIYAKAIYELAK